ncbi:MAG: hypothetical protein AAFY71_13340 [Bacteroidota bacterium]
MQRIALIESLVRLSDHFSYEKLPKEVEKRALQDNPWFTPYYLAQAIEGIRFWFDKEKLESLFLSFAPVEKSIELGIITAGNIPLVGVHDVICGVLIGHRVQVKASRQDFALMEWFIDLWSEELEYINSTVKLTSSLQRIEFLIGTGSNNTSRYFDSLFKDIPKLIRKNRFSIALINRNLHDFEWEGLCEDMLLFNGLGCRNVSNLLLVGGNSIDPLFKKMAEYPILHIHPHYLERILFESTRKGVMNQSFHSTPLGIFQQSNSVKSTEMGVFNVIKVSTEEEALRILQQNKDQIQVVVGEEVEFGQAQRPEIDDFADGINTTKILSSL